MLSWKRSLAVLALVAVWMTPMMSLAASCNCFCGTSSAGAAELSSSSASTTACRESCEKDEKQYVGCYTDSAAYPEKSDTCWAEEECTSRQPEAGNWGGQTYDCEKGYGYCYAPPHNISLNVNIGSLTEVGDIGTYIVTFYTYIIPFSAVVAVVMMMLGGLQYAMARGKAKYIDKAKTRIGNAVTGLVLLLSAYVILNLIDPRLTSFSELRLPLQKEVILLDANSSCEALDKAGFTINAHGNGQRVCTNSGTIISDEDVEGNVNSNLGVGDECEFRTCDGENEGKTCTTQGCKSCTEVEDASSSLCEQMQPDDERSDDHGMKYDCFYNSTSDSCWALRSAGEQYGINCSDLQWRASQGAGCEAYNGDNGIFYGGSSLGTGDYQYAGYDEYLAARALMCVTDICGLHLELSGSTGCYVETGETPNDRPPNCLNQTESVNVPADAVCASDDELGDICCWDGGCFDEDGNPVENEVETEEECEDDGSGAACL